MIRRDKDKAWIICHECDGDDKGEYKPENTVKDAGRILCKILEAEHNHHHIAGIDNPEAGGSRKVHQRDHEKRRCDQKNDGFRYCHNGNRDPDMGPGIDKSAQTEDKLSEALDIKYRRCTVPPSGYPGDKRPGAGLFPRISAGHTSVR